MVEVSYFDLSGYPRQEWCVPFIST